MALLAEGGRVSQRFYKHGPPDGGGRRPNSRWYNFRSCHFARSTTSSLRPVSGKAGSPPLSRGGLLVASAF